MAEALIKVFGKSANVLVKDGRFNNVRGTYYHHDRSQRVTNNGCFNITGNTIQNVGNSHPQVIYDGRTVMNGHISGESFQVSQSPGQHTRVQLGDVRPMTTGDGVLEFMKHQMALMKQEMKSEFGAGNTREQNMAADFNRLGIEDSSPRSSIHGSSLEIVKAGESPSHTTIPNDFTEVDNTLHPPVNINSHIVKNNIVENSFGRGK